MLGRIKEESFGSEIPLRRLKIILSVVGAQGRDERGVVRGGEDVVIPKNEEFQTMLPVWSAHIHYES